MSLLRLLTAGSSLVGLKKPTVRYRMSDPRSLPKFGSAEKLRVRPKATTQAETRQTQSQRLSTLPGKVEEKKEKEEEPAGPRPTPAAVAPGPDKKTIALSKAAKPPAANAGSTLTSGKGVNGE